MCPRHAGVHSDLTLSNPLRRNLIVLWVFLFFMAGVWAEIDGLLTGLETELSISAVFVMAGMIAIFAGIAEYLAGN